MRVHLLHEACSTQIWSVHWKEKEGDLQDWQVQVDIFADCSSSRYNCFGRPSNNCFKLSDVQLHVLAQRRPTHVKEGKNTILPDKYCHGIHYLNSSSQLGKSSNLRYVRPRSTMQVYTVTWRSPQDPQLQLNRAQVPIGHIGHTNYPHRIFGLQVDTAPNVMYVS